jgi:hypothetical protein
MSGKSVDLQPDCAYRGRRLADLAGKGESPVVPRGFEKRQEVDRPGRQPQHCTRQKRKFTLSPGDA